MYDLSLPSFIIRTSQQTLLSDNIWGSKPSTTVPQSLQSTRQSTLNADWRELSEPFASVKESTLLVENVNFFS